MQRSRRRSWILLAVVLAAVALVVVVTSVIPGVTPTDCDGVEFRTATGDLVEVEDGDRPRLTDDRLTRALREALRGDDPAEYCTDFADPYVLRVGDVYYSYATNTGDLHVPVMRTPQVFQTVTPREALPELPTWVTDLPGRVWAPSVLARDDGYVLYFTAAVDEEQQCIGAAVASRPEGPFVARDAPLVCPDDGQAIDPSPFVDADGRAYLLWKDTVDEAIVARELTTDGLGFVGPTRVLVSADQPWEGGVVEGPSMTAADGRSYLFYSGNDWRTSDYATGYAVCGTPLGPCTKPLDEPWLASSERARGPGGAEVFTDPAGDRWLVLHAWLADEVGYPDGARNLFVLRLDFVDGVPVAG